MTLAEKAKAMAKLDLELNGDYRNSPYTVLDDGGYPNKATVRHVHHADGSQTLTLEIVRPAEIVSNELLSNVPPYADGETVTPFRSERKNKLPF